MTSPVYPSLASVEDALENYEMVLTKGRDFIRTKFERLEICKE